MSGLGDKCDLGHEISRRGRTDRMFSRSKGQLIEALDDLVKFAERMPGYEQHPLTLKARQSTRRTPSGVVRTQYDAPSPNEELS